MLKFHLIHIIIKSELVKMLSTSNYRVIIHRCEYFFLSFDKGLLIRLLPHICTFIFTFE